MGSLQLVVDPSDAATATDVGEAAPVRRPAGGGAVDSFVPARCQKSGSYRTPAQIVHSPESALLSANTVGTSVPDVAA